MQISRSGYPQWQAPAQDGQILIWPEPEELLADTIANHRQLAGVGAMIQNVPLHEVRRQQREFIGHSDERSLIASGHQTELHHPGVWAKDVLTNAAAGRLGGEAYQFAVDTDQPKHLHLRWARRATRSVAANGERLETVDWPITDDPAMETAQWAALVDAPSSALIAGIEAALAQTRFSFEPVVGQFLSSLKRSAPERVNLPVAMTNATHELSWSLGLRHHALVCGPLWNSEPYLVFVYHILARCGAFARDYNSALSEFRAEKKIHTPTRPMPDLHVTETSCEVPFWLDDLAGGTRERASVWIDRGRCWLVATNGDELELAAARDGWEAARELGQFLGRNRLRLSPRALTLTLFLRLLVVDNFVHGIGGGEYDQVTDRLIGKHFGIEPPRFAVTTATLYWPDAVGRTRVCLPCLISEGHRLRHSLLGERKNEMVKAIGAAPRGSAERYRIFVEMHRQLSRAALEHQAIRKWQEQLKDAETRSADDRVLFDRELFFGMQPRDRLENVIEQYRVQFGS